MTDDGAGPPAAGTPATRTRTIVFALISILFGLLCCEGMLRALVALSPAIAYRLRPFEVHLNVDGNEINATRELVPDPVLGYRFSPHSGRFDAWGYRNPQVPAQCDVLALGDSMTFGHDVASAESWPRVLAARGALCAYNAGVGGYGPLEYRRVLDDTLKLAPRIVVVGLFLGNDLHDAFRAAYLRDGLPFARWRHPDPAVVAQMLALEAKESLRVRSLHLVGMTDAPTPARDPGGKRRWIADHTAVGSLLREAGRSVDELRANWGSGQPVPVGERNLEPFEVSAAKPHRYGWDHDPHDRTVFVEPDAVALSIDLDDPRIREGARITRAALTEIRDEAARHGARLFVVLIPTKESVYAPFVDPDRDHLPASSARLVAMESRVRGELSGFTRDAGIPTLDALPPLRQSLAAGEAPYHPSDDGHPSATGQAAIARALLPMVAQLLRPEAGNGGPAPPAGSAIRP